MRREVTLVYPREADASSGRVSVLAPIGSALIGLSVGDDIDWPLPDGRVARLRILQNVIRHASVLARGGEIAPEHLPEELLRPATPAAGGPQATLAEIERAHVLRVLEACGGSQVEAARVLGIGRNTLWRKLRAYREANPGAS